jgi:hypothetical protein
LGLTVVVIMQKHLSLQNSQAQQWRMDEIRMLRKKNGELKEKIQDCEEHVKEQQKKY